jgi:molecular chaperone GrpE (heat shock protein)
VDRRLVVPVLERGLAFFATRLEKRGEAAEGLAGWKQRALMDFRLWIADLPEDPPVEGRTDLPSPDLFTLLSEFAALRQEIQMQNREQNRTLRELDGIRNVSREAVELFREKSRALETLEERIRGASEKRALRPFLDVRDALERGLAAARSAAGARGGGWFRSASPDMSGVVEGYEMALRRCDRALVQADIRPVAAPGDPFDPKRMRAVGTQPGPEADRGKVAAVQLTGFVRGDEVIRTAEVVVSE